MRQPRFKTFAPGSTTDFFSWAGSHELARRIVAAWAEVGIKVIPVIERAQGYEIPTFVVRLPGLHNGLPCE